MGIQETKIKENGATINEKQLSELHMPGCASHGINDYKLILDLAQFFWKVCFGLT